MDILAADQLLRCTIAATPGFLNHGNVPLFDTAICELPARTAVVEIGSCAGQSLNVIMHFMRKHRRSEPVFSCDPWPFPAGAIDDSTIQWCEFRRLIVNTFTTNLRFFSGARLPHSFEMTDDDFFAAWSEHRTAVDFFGATAQLGGPLGFCYIDGLHDYESVKRDFENSDRWLVPGGLLLFDDSGDDMTFEDVKRAVREVRASERYDVVASHPCYLLRKR